MLTFHITHQELVILEDKSVVFFVTTEVMVNSEFSLNAYIII